MKEWWSQNWWKLLLVLLGVAVVAVVVGLLVGKISAAIVGAGLAAVAGQALETKKQVEKAVDSADKDEADALGKAQKEREAAEKAARENAGKTHTDDVTNPAGAGDSILDKVESWEKRSGGAG